VVDSRVSLRDEFRALFDRATRSELRGHARIRAGIATLTETRYRVGLIYTHVEEGAKRGSERGEMCDVTGKVFFTLIYSDFLLRFHEIYEIREIHDGHGLTGREIAVIKQK
jgi:hypothetical protein